jgi:hypothetical protein
MEVTVDIRAFARVSAIDTCSVWNLLSSPRLLGSALRNGRWFVVAPYVRYEALEKARSRATEAEAAMQDEFRTRLSAGNQGFTGEALSVADLQAVAALPACRRLGRGEIAALALARRLGAAVLTEDRGARRVAPHVGVDLAQTTPQLLGWLLYEGHLSDSDVPDIISEHEARIEPSRGRITKYFRRIYEEACRYRLLRHSSSS